MAKLKFRGGRAITLPTSNLDHNRLQITVNMEIIVAFTDAVEIIRA